MMMMLTVLLLLVVIQMSLPKEIECIHGYLLVNSHKFILQFLMTMVCGRS